MGQNSGKWLLMTVGISAHVCGETKVLGENPQTKKPTLMLWYVMVGAGFKHLRSIAENGI